MNPSMLLVAEIQKMSKVIEILPDMYNRIVTIQNDISTIKNCVVSLTNRFSTIENGVASVKVVGSSESDCNDYWFFITIFPRYFCIYFSTPFPPKIFLRYFRALFSRAISV